MILEIALILVAYYMGRNGMSMEDVYSLAMRLLGKDEEK